MTALLALPILLPLVGAGCSMIVGRSRAAQRAVSLTVLTAVVGVAVTLLVAVDRDDGGEDRQRHGTLRCSTPADDHRTTGADER